MYAMKKTHHDDLFLYLLVFFFFFFSTDSNAAKRMCGLFHLSSRGDPSCGSLSYRMSESKSPTSVTADNNVIINHIG